MADSIFNFAALFKSTSAYDCRTKSKHEPLYTNPLRRVVKVVLALLVALNSIIFLCGALIAGTLQFDWTDKGTSDVLPSLEPEAIYRVRLFFFFCSIPFVLLIASVVEVIRFRGRSLTPRWIVVSASAGVVLWVAAFGLWANCNYRPWSSLAGVSESYCPYAFSSDGSPLNLWQARIDLVYAIPWIAVGALCCYIAYLACGSVGLHRQRKNVRFSRTALLDDHELEQLPAGHQPSHDRLLSDDDRTYFDPSPLSSPEPPARLPSYHEQEAPSSVNLRPHVYVRPPSYQSETAESS